MKCRKRLKFGYNFTKKVSKHLQNPKISDKISESKSKFRKEDFADSDRYISVQDVTLQINLLLPEHIGASQTLESTQGGHSGVRLKKEKMTEQTTTTQIDEPIQEGYDNPLELEKLNADLSSAANYLIQLFYRTNQKYTCARTKLGKLLSIVAFTYAAEGHQLFSEKIYKYGTCGTNIQELIDLDYDQQIYLVVNDIDIHKSDAQQYEISSAEIDWEKEIPERYKNASIDEHIKRRIEDVFLKFGRFAALVLGEMINSFLPDIVCYDGDRNIVDLRKIETFLSKNDKPENCLVKYIMGYRRDDVNE